MILYLGTLSICSTRRVGDINYISYRLWTKHYISHVIHKSLLQNKIHFAELKRCKLQLLNRYIRWLQNFVYNQILKISYVLFQYICIWFAHDLNVWFQIWCDQICFECDIWVNVRYILYLNLCTIGLFYAFCFCSVFF